jgi:hypothetical protein
LLLRSRTSGSAKWSASLKTEWWKQAMRHFAPGFLATASRMKHVVGGDALGVAVQHEEEGVAVDEPIVAVVAVGGPVLRGEVRLVVVVAVVLAHLEVVVAVDGGHRQALELGGAK